MATAAAGDKQRRLKRRAEDELEDEQPLAKRFGSLNIDQSFHPVSSSSESDERPTSLSGAGENDGMQIDDTKTRVYINDLESEIAEIEKAEEKNKIKFMTEIEREFMAVPNWLLVPRSANSDGHNTDNNQVILYQDPAYLSIPKGLDSQKPAIADAGRKERENNSKADSVPPKGEPPHEGLGGQQVKSTGRSIGQDTDVMDLD